MISGLKALFKVTPTGSPPKSFADTLKDSRELRKWLDRRDASQAKALALRMAARSMPGIASFDSTRGQIDREEDARQLILASFRTLFIGWASILFPQAVNAERVEAASDRLKMLISVFGEYRASCQDEFGGGTPFAIRHYSFINGITIANLILDACSASPFLNNDFSLEETNTFTRDVFETILFLGPCLSENGIDWRSRQIRALRQDVDSLIASPAASHEESASRSLLMSPLWYDQKANAATWSYQFGDMARLLQNIPIPIGYRGRLAPRSVAYWLEERRFGETIFGKTWENCEEKVARIANFPDEFWEHGHDGNSFRDLDYYVFYTQ
jgi:hypothetical protein